MNFINLTVEGINQEGNRIVIKSGGKSYSFFITKQDGTQSRAYQDYMKFGVQIGKTFSFGVTETQKQGQNGMITYRNIGVISESRGTAPVASSQPQQAPYQPQVLPTPQSAQNYQTMSDFELKLLAEISRLSDGYHNLYNEIKVIRLGMPEEVQKASSIYESDDILTQCQDKGLEPNSHLDDIPVVGEDIKVDSVPF
jgi:hypothetical protein